MKLLHSFTLIITADDEETREDMANFFTAKFSHVFGGATVVRGTGGWMNDEGQLITEPNVQVTSFHRMSPANAYDAVYEAVEKWFNDAGQEAVAIITDGVMHVLDLPELPEYLPQ